MGELATGANGCRFRNPTREEEDVSKLGSDCKPLDLLARAVPSSLTRRRFAEGSASCEAGASGTVEIGFRGRGGRNGLKGILP